MRRLVNPLRIGVAWLWISLIVLLPIAAITTKAFDHGWSGFWEALTAKNAVSTLVITVWVSLLVTLINVVMGTVIAWVLVRDDFPGKGVVNALIDLPFALPTAVAVLLYYLANNLEVAMFADIRPSVVVASGVVVLLAGLSAVGSAQDTIDAFYLTAAARTFEVLILSGGIVAGVLGALAGVMGSLMAMEVIRAVTGFGEPQTGWLWLYEGLSLATRRVRIPKDPVCAVCGE